MFAITTCGNSLTASTGLTTYKL